MDNQTTFNLDDNINNLSKENESLIDYLLKIEKGSSVHFEHLTKLLANSELKTNNATIQKSLLKQFYNFRFKYLKTEEEKATFIQRFNIYEVVNSFNSSNFRWLHYFLCSPKNLDFFLIASQYHKNFQQAVYYSEDDNKNCWHVICGLLSKDKLTKDERKKGNMILEILNQYCPDELNIKCYGYTPLEICLEVQQQKLDKNIHDVELDVLIKKVSYYTMQQNLNSTQLHDKKLKI